MTERVQTLGGDDAVSQTDLSPESFSRFARYITRELGIKMSDAKVPMVQSRLLRRVRDLGLESVDQYAKHFFATENESEREQLINAITTNKTDFFREAEHFKFLCEVALPALGSGASGNHVPVKGWSAGCSSGEEPYTLAMVLTEYAARNAGFDFTILGTDISTKVLGIAQSAIYSEAQILPVAPELRRRYLLRSRDKQEQRVRVIPELRAKVRFRQLNFMADDYGLREVFDFVFFRNVMIYFDRATQEAVIARICRNLRPGGFLFVGHSESLAGLNVPVRPVRASTYQKPLRGEPACR
jgi:chemotaxis protein methyltransferase CheR